jgi:hypothetical protein
MRIFLIALVFIINFGINAVAQNKNSPENIGRMMFNAVANGDVSTIKSITTKEFFAREFPMSDQKIRESLLSVPAQRRNILKDLGNNSTASIINIDSDSVIVTYKNNTNGKTFSMKMKKVNWEWKVDEYLY